MWAKRPALKTARCACLFPAFGFSHDAWGRRRFSENRSESLFMLCAFDLKGDCDRIAGADRIFHSRGTFQLFVASG